MFWSGKGIVFSEMTHGAKLMMRFENYSYELTPYPAELGGGWLLRLLADGREFGRRVFVPTAGIQDDELAASAARDDAPARASAWLVSIASRPVSQRPRPADGGGMYLLMPDDEPRLEFGVSAVCGASALPNAQL
jgi:hypothetical protein